MLWTFSIKSMHLIHNFLEWFTEFCNYYCNYFSMQCVNYGHCRIKFIHDTQNVGLFFTFHNVAFYKDKYNILGKKNMGSLRKKKKKKCGVPCNYISKLLTNDPRNILSFVEMLRCWSVLTLAICQENLKLKFECVGYLCHCIL